MKPHSTSKKDQMDRKGYKLKSVIGKGSFGTVYQGTCPLGKPVAIKVQKSRSWLPQNEATILRHLNAPNPQCIVSFYTNFVDNDGFYLAMELLGKTLRDTVRDSDYAGVSYNFVRKIAVQLAEALVFMQHRNVIHCDIKLDNIGICHQRIKLIDFGSARFDDQDVKGYFAGNSLPTLVYRAPEVLMRQPFSFPVDVWGAGCALFELFCGYPLFRTGRTECEQKFNMCKVIGNPGLHPEPTCPTRCIETLLCKKKENTEHLNDVLRHMVRYTNRITARQMQSHPFLRMNQRHPSSSHSHSEIAA